MRISWQWGVLGLLVASVVAFELLLTALLRFQTQMLLDRLTFIRSETALLYRDIGYGGLIHDFKNYVLRFEEAYADGVTETAGRAEAHIASLNQAAQEFGLQVDYSVTHSMIEDYLERVAVVTQMRAEGHSAEAIDQVVRYDDVPALEEIARNEEQITTRINRDLSSVQIVAWLQTLLTTLLSVIALALVHILFSRRTKDAAS